MGTEQAGGIYFYAVVPKSSVPADLGEARGLEDGQVYSLADGGLAAVVSDLPTRDELRPERRLLSAHQRVLDRVSSSSSAVLPVSFGTVAGDPAEVIGLLERHDEDLTEQLRRVEGKLELGVRVRYAASSPSVYEFLVDVSPELREVRDRLVQSGREATRDEKIDLGQKVDAVFQALRDEYAQQVEQEVGEHVESKRNPPRGEREFANLAFLVPAERRAEFDAAIKAAAGRLPDAFVVEQHGPFPAYDFVDLHLQGLPGTG